PPPARNRVVSLPDSSSRNPQRALDCPAPTADKTRMDWFILGGYLLACTLFLCGATLLRVRGHRDRQPFPEQLRLLRGPGESLRRKLQPHRQAELVDILGAFLLPVLAGTALFHVTTRLDGPVQLVALLT